MRRIVGLGGGGHAKVVIDILRLDGGWELIGILDPDPLLQGGDVLGIPVLGGDDLLAAAGAGAAFVGLGSTGSNDERRRLFELATQHGIEVAVAVHPAATVAPTATLGAGATVMAGAVVNPDARIGVNAIVNTAAVVEHDCVVGDHAHIAPGAVLGGGVHVGDGAHVGLGSRVLPGLRIGANARVGAGAVVTHDVEADTVVVGVPARMRDRN